MYTRRNFFGLMAAAAGALVGAKLVVPAKPRIAIIRLNGEVIGYVTDFKFSPMPIAQLDVMFPLDHKIEVVPVCYSCPIKVNYFSLFPEDPVI